jgi:hypothetical protein
VSTAPETHGRDARATTFAGKSSLLATKLGDSLAKARRRKVLKILAGGPLCEDFPRKPETEENVLSRVPDSIGFGSGYTEAHK